MKLATTAVDFSRARLLAETVLWRHGLLPFIALGLGLLALVVCALWLPGQFAAMEREEARLHSLRNMQSTAANHEPATAQLPPEVAFERALASPDHTENVIRRIFVLASENGVIVAQADYRRINDRQGGSSVPLSQLQVALPVKGGFPQIRRYVLSLLAEFPAMSIDQMTIKRESRFRNEVDAQIIISVWERPTGAPLPRQTASGSER